MTTYTARALSTNRLQHVVTQNAHLFVIGDIVIFNGSAWVKSKADTLPHCNATSMVSFIIDANNFVVTQTGYVANLSYGPYFTGTQYYVSAATAGLLTIVMPTGAGEVILPCLVCDTATSGYFYGGSGTSISSGSVFSWSTATTNTNMGSNQGWFTSSGGTLNMALPPVASVGDVVKLSNIAGNFSLIPFLGSTINFGDDVISNFITSTHVGDYIEVVCYQSTPDTLWQTTFSIGNLLYS